MKEIINHEKYGPGVVKNKRYHGFEILVEFTNGIKKWFLKKDLKLEESTKIKEVREKEEFSSDIKTSSTEFSNTDKRIQEANEKEIVNDVPEIRNKTDSAYEKADAHSDVEITSTEHSNVSKDKQKSDEQKIINKVPKRNQDFFEKKITSTKLLKINEITNLPSRKKDLSSRFVIESLRLGGVPQNQVKKFSIGREKELQEVYSWLNSENGSLQIVGEYGTGKSHFLEILSSFALENNWAIVRVEVDAQETPFHKPHKIYESFVNTFSYKQNNSLLDFKDFIKNIIEKKDLIQAKKLRNHPYLGKLFTYWDYEDDKSRLLDWIEGKSPNQTGLPKMYEHQTAANIYCNLISGLGWASKNVLGLNGIIILFDEAETVDPYWYTRYQFDKALNFLKGIILVSNNDASLLIDLPRYRLKVGNITGLIYSGMTNQVLPYCWEKESNIKIIFSFVPEILESMKAYPRVYSLFDETLKVEIETLDENNLQYVLNNIKEMYNEAYNFSVNYNIYPYIPHDKTRKFIKGTVECLDLMRYHPEKSLDNLLRRDNLLINYD